MPNFDNSILSQFPIYVLLKIFFLLTYEPCNQIEKKSLQIDRSLDCATFSIYKKSKNK